jgi:hypothetical protein
LPGQTKMVERAAPATANHRLRPPCQLDARVKNRSRRFLQGSVIVLLLSTLASGSLRGQGSLNGHTVRLDAAGKLLAWAPAQGDAYDQVLGLAANFLLTGVPTAPNGLKLYYSESYATGNPLTGAGWPHNPAGLYAMLTDSGLLYYAYSGNIAMANLVRDVLTYQLDHGMTPSTWHWPSVAYASADSGALTYRGASYGNTTGVGDGVGVIQPDKVGEIGAAFLKYYEFSGTTRFRDAAVQAADVLASHVRPGSATQSPWPFRVYAQTNAIREQYSAHVISSIQLFDELIRLNLGNVAAYQTARQTAWTWLMTYPIQNNVWANYFEDVPIRSDQSNVNQLNAGETARYLMRHPEFDPSWETHVRGIVAWVESRFAVPQYGATSIAEQDAFFYPMGSHTSRYASVNAQLYELTGDAAAKEKAYRSLNWATYMCGPTGIVIDGPGVNHIWWTDGYGDYIKHFLEGVGSVPEWAPSSQSHLLRSTSVVRSVQYAPTDITYQVFDTSAQEVLRLNFTPQSVTADGVLLPKVPDLAQPGWTFTSATGVLRVRHDAGTQIRISGTLLNNNLPPEVRLDSPAPGAYMTPLSLNLTATASDPDGTIASVEFLRNGATLATRVTPPYVFQWTAVPPGTYQLTAAAVDDQGARTTSSAVAIVVSSPAPPPPPTNLVATVAGGAVTLAWTPPVGGPVVATYGVYRSTTSGFTPDAATLIGQPAAPAFADAGVTSGTYYYRVVAFDASGAGSAWSNEATATLAGSLQVDRVVFADGGGTRTTPSISTATAGELLLAFAAADGPSSGGQTLTITGAGLTWTLVTRMNTQPGSSEIWKAVAPGVLANATVTSTPSRTGFDQSLTVVTFAGAGGTGASAGASGVSAPGVSLTPTRTGSLVYGVGNDWDRAVARTVGAAQALVHQWVDTAAGDTFWVQQRTPPTTAGTLASLNDTAPTSGRWNFAAVEIVPAGSISATVPETRGQAQAAAQALLTAAGFVVGTVTSQSSTTAPIGVVTSQSPAGGTQAVAGSAVNLVLSSGVTVPNVLGQPRATAESQISGAGLAIGTETSQPSATVPLGAVISQSPAGNAQASAGTPVNLVLSDGPSAVTPLVDQNVSSDGSGTRTTPAFNTASAGEVLLAFAASDGPSSGSQSLTVSGASLTWTLVKRINAQRGSSEIWRATATSILTNVTVTSTPTVAGYRQSLTVVTFRGASGVGASVTASAATGAPTVSLTTTRANALVYGVGNDWDRAVGRVPGSGQVLVHQWVETVAGDTYWVQARTAPIANAGTVVQVNDTSPTNDRWNLAAVEIVP